MLLIEHKQRAWGAVSGLVLVTAACVYFLASRGEPEWPAGGSLVGLWFGIAGSAMMVFAALLALRRRFPTLRVGSGEFWLRAHLWIGTLSFLFILLHSGFRLGGPLERWLWLSFTVVILSGFYLLLVQQVLPRYLTAQVPSETFAEQIPYLCRRLTVQADEAVSGCYGTLPLDGEPLRDAIYDIANPSRYGQAKTRQKEFVQLATKIYGRAPASPSERGFPIEEKDEEPAARPARGAAAAGAARPTAAAPVPGAAPANGPAGGTTPAVQNGEAEEKPAAKPSPKAAGGMSPLEQMRAKQAAGKLALAAGGAAPAATDAAAPAAAPNGAAAATDAPPASADKPLSKMELARAQMAAKKAAAAAPSESAPAGAPPVESSPTATVAAAEPAPAPADKPLSKMELARAQMAAKKAAATVAAPSESAPAGAPLVESTPSATVAAAEPAPAPADKPLSKMELARAQMAAKKAAAAASENVPAVAGADGTAAAEAPPNAATDKPLSKIELMRAQAAAKQAALGGAAVTTAVKPVAAVGEAAVTKPAPPAKPTAPAKPASPAAPAAMPAPAVARKTSPPEKQSLPLPRAEDLLEFYLKAVRPFLEFDETAISGSAVQAAHWKRSLATPVQSEQTFANLRRTLPVELHAALDLLERCCNERRDYRLQQRIRRWLHGCLLLHIPASAALIVFFLIHVLTALRVIPF